MRRQYTPLRRTMERGSFGTPQVRVIVIGEGDAHRYDLRALVTRVLREELGDDVAAFRDDAEPCLDLQASLPARSTDTKGAPLSTRELEVLGMLARGRRNKEI